MKSFEQYVQEGYVHNIQSNYEISKALYNDSLHRFRCASELNIVQYGKVVFEMTFDAMIALIDSFLISNGYKSYLSEASLAYLKIANIPDTVISVLDHFRNLRDQSKHYGSPIPANDITEILSFYQEFLPVMQRILRQRIQI
jgi:hypothetical protein